MRVNRELRGVPALPSVSAHDAWVPLARALETAARHRAIGAAVDVQVRDGEAHIDADEIACARKLLEGLGRP